MKKTKAGKVEAEKLLELVANAYEVAGTRGLASQGLADTLQISVQSLESVRDRLCEQGARFVEHKERASEKPRIEMTVGPKRTIKTGGLVDEKWLWLVKQAYEDAGTRGLTRKGLASKLQMSTRSVDRARELLEEQNAKFVEHKDGGSRVIRFEMTEGPNWDSEISPRARLALNMSAEALSHGGGHLFREQLNVFEDLADQTMTNRDRDAFNNLRKNVKVIGGFDDDPTEEQAHILATILLAFSKGVTQELELEYRLPMHTRSWPFKIAPYGMTHDMFSGGSYLLGWDVAKEEIIQLRISRITAVKETGRPAIIPNPERLIRAARFQIGGWIGKGKEFEVKIQINKASWIQSMMEAQPDFPDFSIVPSGRNTALVTFKANQLQGPLRWVLQMGEDAVVLEPEALKKDVRRKAQALLDHYTGTSEP